MLSQREASAALPSRPWPFVRLAATFAVVSFLLGGVQALSIASTDVENEDQIHEFNRHLPRYNHKGNDLRELAANAPDKTVRSVSAPPAVGIMNASGPDGERLFDADVCKADATVIGDVITFKTLLSADNSTVFTDHKIAIDKVVENRSPVALQAGKPVIVTLNGGTFSANGLKIEQVGFDRPGPLTPSRKYLFLLNALSNGASFSASGSFAIEYIDDTGLHVVSQHPFRDNVNRFLEAFSSDSIEQYIRQTITNCSSVGN